MNQTVKAIPKLWLQAKARRGVVPLQCCTGVLYSFIYGSEVCELYVLSSLPYVFTALYIFTAGHIEIKFATSASKAVPYKSITSLSSNLKTQKKLLAQVS